MASHALLSHPISIYVFAAVLESTALAVFLAEPPKVKNFILQGTARFEGPPQALAGPWRTGSGALRQCSSCHVRGPVNVCNSGIQHLFEAHETKFENKTCFWYADETTNEPAHPAPDRPWDWAVKEWLPRARARQPFGTYSGAATDMYEALDSYPVRDKSVLVAGSASPWVEVILNVFGAHTIVTSEFRVANVPSNITRMVHVDALSSKQWHSRFSAVVAYSSIEHDGLGRYGDPINPEGDFAAMAEFWRWLKPGGVLYLAVPITLQASVRSIIQSNLHRMYGARRLANLFLCFDLLRVVVTSMGWWQFERYGMGANTGRHPLFILQKPRNGDAIDECMESQQSSGRAPTSDSRIAEITRHLKMSPHKTMECSRCQS